ncbi:hypothetical protein [Erysiphe necator associated tombus-like virus 4]|nr:hypothetical protein [Erysiphe necator associated tombus-like virus 4]
MPDLKQRRCPPGPTYGANLSYYTIMATTQRNTDMFTLAGMMSHFESKARADNPPVQGPWQPKTELDELEIEVKAISGVVNEVIGGVSAFVGKWWFPSKVPQQHQAVVRDLQDKFDTVCDDVDERFLVERDTDGKVKVRKPRRGNADWWVAYSVMARGKFLSPSNTMGMRRTIHKWIYEHMEADKVRKLDISRNVHRATEWVYHATESEVLAAMDRNSTAMVERERAIETRWWSYWWGVSRRSIGSD